MNNKNIFCAACLIFSPPSHGNDTASATISLHIPDRLALHVLNRAPSHQADALAEAFFCVGDTSGLQFSVLSDDLSSTPNVVFTKTDTLSNRNLVQHSRGTKECHERNSGVLQVTQLPQGTRTVTAVVVAE